MPIKQGRMLLFIVRLCLDNINTYTVYIYEHPTAGVHNKHPENVIRIEEIFRHMLFFVAEHIQTQFDSNDSAYLALTTTGC